MKRRVFSSCLAAALVVTALGGPARAASFGESTLAFRGTASLPKFPCALGDRACAGTFDGFLSGVLAGSQYGVPWTAVLADAPVLATFTYADTVANCSAGIASGTLSSLSGYEHVLGTYGQPDPLPRPVASASVTGSFRWTRVGTVAQLSITDVTVQLEVGGTGWVTVLTGGVGQALAAFGPGLDSGNLPDCVGYPNRPPVDTTVAGTAVVAQAAG